MTNQSPLRLAIVGCGRIAQSYLQAFQHIPSVKLQAAVDLREDAAELLAKSGSCTAFSDLKTCLEKTEVDAAIVCTPPNTHRELCCHLLEAGKHVLCEKPLATSLEAGLKMMQTARLSKKILMMASKFRYVHDLITIKEWIASGKIGHVLHYENCFSGNVDMSHRWNTQLEISGGGVLIDNGSHAVDIARCLLGPIQSVRAKDISLYPNGVKNPCEDSVELSFIAHGDIPGSIYLSWNTSFGRPGYVSLSGSKGRVRACWDKLEYQTGCNKNWDSLGKGYNKIEAFSAKIENFANVILGKQKPMISEKDSLASLAVIEAAYQSLKSGKWEDVVQEYR